MNAINHDGEHLNEILNISKVEEVKIMLDEEHELHNKLILITFLLVEERAAVSLAMVAIVTRNIPPHLKPSTVIEAIITCNDSVVGSLIELFQIQNFFTSDNAKAKIKLMIEEDDAYLELRK